MTVPCFIPMIFKYTKITDKTNDFQGNTKLILGYLPPTKQSFEARVEASFSKDLGDSFHVPEGRLEW